MKTIRFSHRYAKLKNLDKAKLIECIKTKFEDLHQSFFDYDTQNGLYKFPDMRTECFVLIFKRYNHIFTTIRTIEENNVEHFSESVGQTFKIWTKE